MTIPKTQKGVLAKRLEHAMYDYVHEMFGESEARNPSWAIPAMALRLADALCDPWYRDRHKLEYDEDHPLITCSNDLCDYLGEPRVTPGGRRSRDVYKATKRGGWLAWLRLRKGGITIGMTADGSDAEFSQRLDYPFTVDCYKLAWEELNLTADKARYAANNKLQGD